jgi:hypothetical protein
MDYSTQGLLAIFPFGVNVCKKSYTRRKVLCYIFLTPTEIPKTKFKFLTLWNVPDVEDGCSTYMANRQHTRTNLIVLSELIH